MAVEIKSNYSVIDELGRFPYSTSYGNTFHQELYDFTKKTNLSGFTQTDFNATDAMISALKSLGVWNSIQEFLPFFGNTIDSQVLKLKSTSNTLAEKHNSIDNTFIDGKGLNYTSQLVRNAKGVKLGISNLDILKSNTGFGVISYFQNNPSLVAHDMRILFGQSAAVGTLTTGDVGIGFLSSSDLLANHNFDSSNYFTNSVDTMLYFSLISWNSSKQISKRLYRGNGTQLLKSTSTVNITAPSYEDFPLIGAQKVKNSNDAMYGWAGKIRLFITYDGTIAEDKISAVESAINTFLSATGKTLS